MLAGSRLSWPLGGYSDSVVSLGVQVMEERRTGFWEFIPFRDEKQTGRISVS